MSKIRQPRRISKNSLENAALHYLERFSSSAENLRRVLLRRVERAVRVHGDDPEEGRALVADLVARYQTSGLLDDRLYAEAKASSLLRRGRSQRAIRQNLAGRGVDAEIIDQALDTLVEDGGAELDHSAALALARRRRLGPFRPAESRAAHRDRDLAALGRAGFSWEVARVVIDGDEE